MTHTILEIVREYVGAVALSPTEAFSDLGIDSLEFIQLVRQVEDQLKIRIPDDALSRIHTINDLAAEALRSPSN